MTHSIYNLFLKNRGVASLMYLFVEKGVKMMGILIIGEGIASFFFEIEEDRIQLSSEIDFRKGYLISLCFTPYIIN